VQNHPSAKKNQEKKCTFANHKLANWRIGELANWRIGELANWRIGELKEGGKSCLFNVCMEVQTNLKTLFYKERKCRGIIVKTSIYSNITIYWV
jgi:hypothetical protein